MEENKTTVEEQIESVPETEQQIDEQSTVTEPAEAQVESAEAQAEPAPKKKKKLGIVFGIIGGVLAVIIAIILIFALKDNKNLTRNSFINDIGGVSETFIGAVSKREYDSAEDAAEGFVDEEVVGDSYATIQSINSLGEVSSSEHKIPAEFLEGSEKVEKVEVEFTVPSEAAIKREVQLISSSGSGETKAKVVVYVIKYEREWRYFAPLPVTGDTISKSYYDSIFNNEKYRNCTYEITQNTKSKAFGITAGEYTLYQLFKFEEGKVYIEQKETTVELGKTTVKTLYFYAEELDNGYLDCYIKEDNGDWQEAELINIGFYSLEELTPFYDSLEFDYTYFKKTDYGFELPNENISKYFTDTFAYELRKEGLDVDEENIDTNMYYEFFVQEGTLTAIRLNADINLEISESGVTFGTKVEMSEIAKVYDYGTTVVEKPVMD